MHEDPIPPRDRGHELDVDGRAGGAVPVLAEGQARVATARLMTRIGTPSSPHVMQWFSGLHATAGDGGALSLPLSLDLTRLQVFELLLVVGAQALEQVAGRKRLVLIHLGDREANVDQDPITRLHVRAAVSSRAGRC